MEQISQEEINEILSKVDTTILSTNEEIKQMVPSSSGGSKSIRNRNRRSNRSNRMRNRHRVQHGGSRDEWITHACQLIFPRPAANENPFTTLGFYQLIMFLGILDYLQLSELPLHQDKCNALVGIIQTNLTNEDILASYINSMLAGTTGPGVVAGAATVAWYWESISSIILSGIHFILSAASTIAYSSATKFIIRKVLAAYTFLGARLTFSIGMMLYSLIRRIISTGPRGVVAAIAPPRVKGESYAYTFTTNACEIAQSQVQKTFNVFHTMTTSIYSISTAILRAGSAAKGYYQNPRTIQEHAVTTLLDYVTSKGAVTPQSIQMLEAQLQQILREIGQNKLLREHVPAGTTKCTDANIAQALAAISPIPGQLDPTAAHVAAAASPEPVFAAAPQAVLADVSQPQIVASGPATLSVPPPQPQLQPVHQRQQQQQPIGRDGDRDRSRSRDYDRSGDGDYRGRDRGWDRGWDRGNRDRGNRDRGNRDMDRDRDRDRDRGGGSSKHKKKHPRSTNKRKFLVKRVRRRSMKHKKKM